MYVGFLLISPTFHQRALLRSYSILMFCSYFGHGSGSSVVTQSLIRQTTCNAISFLMGCERLSLFDFWYLTGIWFCSVRTIPQAHGFDGTSVIQDYAMAKCPSLVGCLWDVQGGPKVW